MQTDAEFMESLFYILQDNVQKFIKLKDGKLLIGTVVDSFYFDGYTLDEFEDQFKRTGFLKTGTRNDIGYTEYINPDFDDLLILSQLDLMQKQQNTLQDRLGFITCKLLDLGGVICPDTKKSKQEDSGYGSSNRDSDHSDNE
jgi:hypothetical protein